MDGSPTLTEPVGILEAVKDTTDTTQPLGTSSVEIVGRMDGLWKAHETDFTFYKKDILAMLKAYFKKSMDRTSNPQETFESFSKRLSDDGFYLLFYKERDMPTGFLSGQMRDGRAEILAAYLPQDMKKRLMKDIMDNALTQFEIWAVHNKAVSMVFFTFRDPGAHRDMIRRMWKYMTVYEKEIT